MDAKRTHAKATFITKVAWNPSEHDLPDHLYRMMGLFTSLNDNGVIIPDLIRAACLLSSVEKSGEDVLTHIISDAKSNAHVVDIVLRTLMSTIPIATVVQEIDLLHENDPDNLSVNSVSIQSALPSSNRYRKIFPIDVSRYLNPRPLTYPALPDPTQGVSSSPPPPDNLEDDCSTNHGTQIIASWVSTSRITAQQDARRKHGETTFQTASPLSSCWGLLTKPTSTVTDRLSLIYATAVALKRLPKPSVSQPPICRET